MIRKPIILFMLVLGLAFAPQTADAATQWEIQQAQEMLNTLGYDAGTADGYMGARTRNAIRAFESDMGLSMTGTVDQFLLDELSREVGGGGVDPVDYAYGWKTLSVKPNAPGLPIAGSSTSSIW